MIGCDHGEAYLRLLAERLCAEGAPLVAIDPDTKDLRARGAGFTGEVMVATEAGVAVLMVYDPRRVANQFGVSKVRIISGG